MFDAHQMIAEHGINEARRLSKNKLEHSCINAAAAMLAAFETEPEPAWASMMVTALPHRQPLEGNDPALHWCRQIGFDEYRFDSGYFDDGSPVGIPYGAKARLILIGTHTRVLHQHSLVPDVPHSRNAYLKELGVEGGGMTYKRVTDQSRRVASCTLSIAREDQTRLTTPLVDFFIYDSGIFSPSKKDIDSLGFSRQIIVNPGFYDLIYAEPIKLDRRALQIISDNSWAIDLYIWFAGTLPGLAAPQLLTWKELEFGSGVNYKRSRQTRGVFLSTLQLVKAIYPQARVEVADEGFVLHPSPPPL
ncbi:MAG: replication protein RepA [Porticoccaceae bacterium]|jgi:hypothetical protein